MTKRKGAAPDHLKSAEHNLAESEKLLKKMQEDRAREDALDHLPPEVILRARRLSRDGKFKRQVVKRSPSNFTWDTLELECGHTARVLSREDDAKPQECNDCLEEWLLRRRKQRGKKAK